MLLPLKEMITTKELFVFNNSWLLSSSATAKKLKLTINLYRSRINQTNKGKVGAFTLVILRFLNSVSKKSFLLCSTSVDKNPEIIKKGKMWKKKGYYLLLWQMNYIFSVHCITCIINIFPVTFLSHNRKEVGAWW